MASRVGSIPANSIFSEKNMMFNTCFCVSVVTKRLGLKIISAIQDEISKIVGT